MAAKTYNFTAAEATREKLLLRAGFCGPTGSGKSLTALKLATRMEARMGLGRVFVIDTEHKSALRYAFSPRTQQGFKFRHLELPEDDFSPAAYLGALDYCEDQGAGVIVIDSLSHEWNGINGVLELVDEVTGKSRSKNTFSEGWKAMTPVHARFVERLMQARAHVIFTLRAKVDWIVAENDRGKLEPKKVGLAPVQREGLDYEPDLFFDMAAPENDLWVTKSRAIDRPGLEPGTKHKKPGDAFCDLVIDWLDDGEVAPPPPKLDPLDAREPNKRAEAWKDAIRVADILAIETLVERAKGEPHPKLRADIGTWIARRRADISLDPQATPGDRAASPPPPPPTNGAVAMSDEECLRAIDQGRA